MYPPIYLVVVKEVAFSATRVKVKHLLTDHHHSRECEHQNADEYRCHVVEPTGDKENVMGGEGTLSLSLPGNVVS